MKMLSSLVLVVLLTLNFGCATMVNKEAARSVKKVGIVSIWGNGEVPERKGRGKAKNWDLQMQKDVANFAVQTYTKKMEKLGWKMVSPQQVMASKEYRDLARVPTKASEGSTLGKFMNKLQESKTASTFTPEGMVAIKFNDADSSNNTYYMGDAKNYDPRAVLAKWAKEMGVDAVAVVQMVFCYKGGTWSMGGTGEAVLTSSSSIKVVNQAGETIVNMPNETQCDSKYSAESTNSAAMVGGDLVFNSDGKFKKMFEQATDGAAEIAVARIKEGMAD